jgi:hypothetical protein
MDLVNPNNNILSLCTRPANADTENATVHTVSQLASLAMYSRSGTSDNWK